MGNFLLLFFFSYQSRPLNMNSLFKTATTRCSEIKESGVLERFRDKFFPTIQALTEDLIEEIHNNLYVKKLIMTML